MLLQIPFFEERTIFQILWTVHVFRTEPGTAKTTLVVRSMVGRVMQHGTELFELVVLGLSDRPVLTRQGSFLEFSVTRAVTRALRQLPVNGPEHELQPARQRVVGVQQRIKSVFQAHGVCLSRYTRHHSSKFSRM